MTLDNLVGRGLEREPTDASEVARLLLKAERRLADSAQTSISLDTRFDTAYEALLQIALAALRANGLRVSSQPGHQALAIQCLAKSIGLEKNVVRLVDEFRKKRAAGLYEADFEPSVQEVEGLREAVVTVRVTFIAWLRKHRADLLQE